MVLLPKVTRPEDPKQVRPICIGSAAASKAYCRLLVERTKQELQYMGSAQSMGSGRQTCDYIFCVARMMQVEQEWRRGSCYLKLDIEKAFDSLNRQAFLERLHERMGSDDPPQLVEDVPGHQGRIVHCMGRVVTGIKQGSAESPQMLAPSWTGLSLTFGGNMVGMMTSCSKG